jgi:hypothetical protein
MRPRCVIGVVCSLRMFEIAVISKGRISLGRKKTLAELDAETGRLSPEPGVAGEPKQEFDQKLNVNHWKYHRRLDPSWDNAAWASSMIDNTARDSPYYGDKYFDRTGKKQNALIPGLRHIPFASD